MTFRYIGSKFRIVDQLREHIGPPSDGFFVDAFCGTGVVAEAAAALGWRVRLNDHLVSATVSAAARLTCTAEAQFRTFGGYEKAIADLNAAALARGFIWREYSPAARDHCGVERRYFTESNAARIDGMRNLIREWRSAALIDETEERLLIADLLSALNRVANIAGTFGCFLSKWTTQAIEPIAVRPRALKIRATVLEISVGDVFDVTVGPEDLVYLDPPYTKRQYASYYHILETVALGDEPNVEGVSGLRPWKDRASDFCYKVRALKTLVRLIAHLPAKRLLLSYSSEGHIDLDDLRKSLNSFGTAAMHPLAEVGRYRPNRVASSAGDAVTEFLVAFDRSVRAAGAVAA
jgi:adenine-specific DNA-methyltransferase